MDVFRLEAELREEYVLLGFAVGEGLSEVGLDRRCCGVVLGGQVGVAYTDVEEDMELARHGQGEMRGCCVGCGCTAHC